MSSRKFLCCVEDWVEALLNAKVLHGLLLEGPYFVVDLTSNLVLGQVQKSQEVEAHVGLLVTSVDGLVRFNLTNDTAVDFADLHVSARVILEEEVLVLRVGLNPALLVLVLEQSHVSLSLEVLRLVAKEQLLEVGVVEDVRVHAPAGVETLLLESDEAKSMVTH